MKCTFKLPKNIFYSYEIFGEVVHKAKEDDVVDDNVVLPFPLLTFIRNFY